MLCVTLVAPFFHLSSYGFYISSKKQNLLKYGFCNKSFRKDEPLTSWTLFSNIFVINIRFSSNQNIGEGESNFDEICWKKCSTDQRFIFSKWLVTKSILSTFGTFGTNRKICIIYKFDNINKEVNVRKFLRSDIFVIFSLIGGKYF